MNYELNKGIGESAEFKGLKAQYLFYFRRWAAGSVRAVCYSLYGRREPVVLHCFRRNIRIRIGPADFPSERQVRGTRTDEAAGQETAPPLPDQPDQSPETIHD